jgi:hypothetical protein
MCLSRSLLALVQEVVNGHADAFTGKTFVFSGVLPSLFRDAAKDLVLSHGGRVTGTVQSKPACAGSAVLLCVCSCRPAALLRSADIKGMTVCLVLTVCCCLAQVM